MPYKKERKKDEFDDTRGPNKMGGWWINENRAGLKKGGVKWWKTPLDRRSVDCVQHDGNGPLALPIWRYENGDMYLGEWKKYSADIKTIGSRTRTCKIRNKNCEGTMVEHGFGVSYNKCGLVHVGEWRNGLLHGRGRSTWMENSVVWRKNYLPKSPICRRDGKKKKVPLPFSYTGEYSDSKKHDNNAHVELKDGTSRYGPWKDDYPKGDWWQDHKDGNIHPAARYRTPSVSSLSQPSFTAEGTTGINPSDIGGSSPQVSVSSRDKSDRLKRKRGSNDANSRHSAQKKRTPQKQSLRAKTDIVVLDASSEDEDVKIKDEDTMHIEFESISDQARVETGHMGNEEEFVDSNCALSKERIVEQIEKWLITIFGGTSEHIQTYARKLYDIGAYPPKKFVEVCTVDDVKDFTWMLTWHRKMFEKWLFNEKC